MENLERFAQVSERFGFLINGGSVASVSYALETLPFMVGESYLFGMEFRSLTVSAWGSYEAYGSALLDHCFCFGTSGNVVIVLFLTRGNVMTFLGLSYLPWMLYLSGKLF